jgi:hypothetical protein
MAKTAEPISEVVFSAAKKWWLDATMTPTTSQMTAPSEILRVRSTA